jgi:hypothetical protein
MSNPFVHEDNKDEGGKRNEGEELERESESLDISPVVSDPDEDGGVDISMEEPPKVSRADKKRNRYQEQINARADAEREKVRLEMENLKLRQQLMSGQLPGQTPQKDPLDEEIEKNYQDRTRSYEAFQAKVQAGTLTPDENERFINEARKMEEKQQALISRREYQRLQAKNSDPDSSMKQIIRARHPDVIAHPDARKWVGGRFVQRSVREGESVELVDEIMEEARKEFGIGKYKDGPPPTDRQKERYQGSGSRSAPKSSPKRSVRLSPAQQSMAEALYPNMGAKEAWTKWAKEVGPGVSSE